jgi:hypothetical protein
MGVFSESGCQGDQMILFILQDLVHVLSPSQYLRIHDLRDGMVFPRKIFIQQLDQIPRDWTCRTSRAKTSKHVAKLLTLNTKYFLMGMSHAYPFHKLRV